MGVIFLDGIIMLTLVLAGLREAIMNAIPRDLRLATGAGIGLFIAFLGLVNAQIVKMNIADAPLTAGSLTSADAKVAIVGVVITALPDGLEYTRRDFDRHRCCHRVGVPFPPIELVGAFA